MIKCAPPLALLSQAVHSVECSVGGCTGMLPNGTRQSGRKRGRKSKRELCDGKVHLEIGAHTLSHNAAGVRMVRGELGLNSIGQYARWALLTECAEPVRTATEAHQLQISEWWKESRQAVNRLESGSRREAKANRVDWAKGESIKCPALCTADTFHR